MNCPNCGKEISGNQKFCTRCGYKFEQSSNNLQNTKKGDDYQTSYIVACLLFGIVIFAAIIIAILNYFGTKASNILNDDNINYTPYEQKAKNCEDVTVKDLAIQIFKDNNKYYKAIDKSSIKSIELIYPAFESYDSTFDRYTCTAQIVMKSNSTGFLPEEYDIDNEYYNRINDSWFQSGLAKHTQYTVDISYTSEISGGSTFVTTSDTYSKFSCEGSNCERISNKKYDDKPQEQSSYETPSYQEKKEIKPAPKPAPKPEVKEESDVEETITPPSYKNIDDLHFKEKNYNKEAENELF